MATAANELRDDQAMTSGNQTAGPAPGFTPETQKLFVAALQAHQVGRLEEAEQGYRRVLQADPKQPDALHLLGVIAHQARQNEAAVQLISQAIAIRGNDPDFHNNIGEAYRALGRHEEAINHFRRALSLQPVNPGASCNMGSALIALGKTNEAIESFKKALGFKPDFAEAKGKLGGALLRLPKDDGERDLDRAIELLRVSIGANPEFVEGYVNLGNALMEKGEREEAIEFYRKALQKRPEYVRARFNLGVALMDVGRLLDGVREIEQALALEPENVDMLRSAGDTLIENEQLQGGLQCYRKALELAPGQTELNIRLGDTLSRAGFHGEAAGAYEKAVAADPNHLELQKNLGFSLIRDGQATKAIEVFEGILENDLGSSNALFGIGRAKQELGAFDEAEPYLRQAAAATDRDAHIFNTLVTDRNYQPSDAELARYEALSKNEEAGPEQRAAAAFGVANTYHQREDYDRAFGFFELANRLVRSEVKVDYERWEQVLRQHREVFDQAFFQERWAHGADSDRPVFVVGMPRSGTTLVNQIIGSHPVAAGVGELTDLTRIAGDLVVETDAKLPFPAVARTLDGPTTRRFAHRYLDRIEALAPGQARVVDKLPGNFIRLGLIGLLFPNAHVIHTRRDPMATCLSCYMQNFNRNLNFAFGLEDLGRYYRVYEAIMDHWRDVRPVQMLEIDYEALVADLPGVSRRMIEFIGLEWDDRCLDFHKSENTVSTASIWQVRQPIYGSSVEGWRHYESHLEPLRTALEGPALEGPALEG